MSDPVDGSILETHKENIVPSREGRSAQAISQLYSVPRAQRTKELAAAHAHYRELISRLDLEASINDESSGANEDATRDDPLSVYCQYIHWIMDNYPSGSSSESGLLTVLEEATRRFCGEAMYKNDVRYVKLWIEYANLVEQSERVFAFMLANDIGTIYPYSYEYYAVVLERNKNLVKADGIYRLAIARKVQGVDIIKARYKGFQARCAASSTSPSHSPSVPEESGESTPSRRSYHRAPLQSAISATPAGAPARSPFGQRNTLGSARTPSTSRGLSAQTPSAGSTTPLVSRTSEVPASTPAPHTQPYRVGLGLVPSSSLGGAGRATACTASRNVGKLSVFQDATALTDPSSALSAAPDVQTNEWSKLDTRAESVKENNASAVDGAIHQKVEKKMKPKIEIFRDETFGSPSSSTSLADITTTPVDQVFRPKANTTHDALSRDPLQNFGSQFAFDVDIPSAQ